MAHLIPPCLSGTLAFCEMKRPADWSSLNRFLQTEEACDDFDRFRCSIMDVYSSLALTVVSENEVPFGWYSNAELIKLETHYFFAYLLSSGRMQLGMSIPELLEDFELDGQVFSLLNGSYAKSSLMDYITHLDELESVHKYFAYQKGLVKCDFIKSVSDAEEIFQKLRPEKKWNELSDNGLRARLHYHLSLRQLSHNSGMMDDDSAGNMPEGQMLLEMVNLEYSKSLAAATKKFEETKMKINSNHLEFTHLVHKRVYEAEATRTECLPKGCSSITQKLFQLKDMSLDVETWLWKKIPKHKARVNGSYGGPSTRFVTGAILLAVSLTALGIRKQAA